MMTDRSMLTALIERLKERDLDDLLGEISVEPIDDGEMKGWYGVSTDEGIVAYFNNEAEAFHYRLDLINRILNG